MSGPWEQFAGAPQAPFNVSTSAQAAQAFDQGKMSREQLASIEADMFKRGTGGAQAFKEQPGKPWESFQQGTPSAAAPEKTPTGILSNAKQFTGNLVSDFRDFGDMFLGSPAAAIKATVESAVSAYKQDPRAGLQAGQELAQNPYFAPWLHPLASAQQAVTRGEIKPSEFQNLMDKVVGGATEAAAHAGRKVGVPEATTKIIADNVMATLGLKGLSEGVRMGEEKPAVVKPGKAPAPAPAEPQTLEHFVQPHIAEALQNKAREIYDKTPEEHLIAGQKIGPEGETAPEPAAPSKPTSWVVPRAQRGSIQPEVFKEGIQRALGQKTDTLKDQMEGEKYSSRVLDRLPQGKTVFSEQQVRSELNRQDVPGVEKDAFNSILSMFSRDGRISAPDLVKGFKLATEQYHLTPEETEQFSDVGITHLGRELDSGETTTKYQLPFDVPQTNHFGDDPRQFGWTRSFLENGKRHVVELQSDLAQRGQLEEPEQVRNAYREKLRDYEAKLPKYEEAERTGEDVHSARIVRETIADLKKKLAEPLPKGRFKALTSNWERRLVQEELARSGGRPVRFATPDTVAKVENWPTQPIYKEAIASVKLKPEHQSIYDRYKRNVVPYLKQLGGKEVTDEHGHTWIEVQPQAAARARMYGHADVELLKKLGIASAGGLALYYADPQDKWNAFATGAALSLAGVWLAPKIREGLKADTRIRIDKYTNDFETALGLAEVKLNAQVKAIQEALPDAGKRAEVTRALDTDDTAGLDAAQLKVFHAARQFFKTAGEAAQKAGVLGELRDSYVTHIWDTPVNRGKGALLTTRSPFEKARKFETLAEGKAAGYVPKTEDLAEIMQIYGRSMNRAIAGRTFIDTLRGLKTPDGKPIVAAAKGAPRGYVPVDLPQLRGNLVHPDIAASIRMFESPQLGHIMQKVSETMQAIKRVQVVGSLFHLKTLGEVAIGSREVGKLLSTPRQAVNFALGRDAILKDLNNGGMSGVVQDAIKHGVNMSLERRTPGVEDIGGSFYQGMSELQNWLDLHASALGHVSKGFTELNHKLDTLTWARFQTGWKILLFDEARQRLMRNGVEADKAGDLAASYVNTQFGGLNWRRIAEGARTRMGRDIAMAMLHPRSRAMSQILLFAPDWTVSTLRQITQAVKRSGGPLEQAKGLLKPTELADLHRLAMIRGAVYYFTIGNAVNLMLSGHNVWDNKNPLRIELGNGQTMAFSKHLTEPLEWLRHPMKTAGGKLSYLPSEAIDQLTGREYIGGPPMEESRIVHAAKGVLPFTASSSGPLEALSGAAGFPIYGHTPEQLREMARERRVKRFERQKQKKDRQ